MKPKYQSYRLFSVGTIGCAAIVICATSALTQSASAATGTWSGGETGTWDTSDTNWSDVSGMPWDDTNGPNNDAVFNTASLNATVSGAVYTSGITFGTSATLGGTGSINLAGTSSISVASGQTGTINSVLAGSGTLTKSGDGTLTIDGGVGANSFNGEVIVDGGTLANTAGAKGLWVASSFTVNNGGILQTDSDGLGYGPANPITVNAGGTMRGGVQGLGSLTMNGGLLDGTGSYLDVNFFLTQDVTVGGSSPSTIQGNAGIALNGYEAAPGATRTFNVADATGDGGVDLSISTVRNAYGPSNNLTNLQKSGAGFMLLAGTSTYTGETIVNEGALIVVGILGDTAITVNNPGTLIGHSLNGLNHPITLNGGSIAFWNNHCAVGALTMNGGTLSASDGVDNNWQSVILTGNVTVGGSSASVMQTYGSTANGIHLADYASGGSAVRTFDVADATGNGDADLIVSAPLLNGRGDGATVGLDKTGAGTMLLSGVNTYTGETIVLEGTLAVNGSSLHDSTKLVIDGGTVDLTGAETVNTLFFGGVQQAVGTYSANGTTLTGSGTLIVNNGPGSGTNYAAWQSANVTSQAANLDHDNDGISNGVEHFLGGIANTTGNSNPLPGVINTAGTLSVTWVRNSGFSGFPANYGTAFVVETSATLESPWTPAVQGVGAGFVEITGDNVKYIYPAGTKNFARLKVIAP